MSDRIPGAPAAQRIMRCPAIRHRNGITAGHAGLDAQTVEAERKTDAQEDSQHTNVSLAK